MSIFLKIEIFIQEFRLVFECNGNETNKYFLQEKPKRRWRMSKEYPAIRRFSQYSMPAAGNVDKTAGGTSR